MIYPESESSCRRSTSGQLCAMDSLRRLLAELQQMKGPECPFKNLQDVTYSRVPMLWLLKSRCCRLLKGHRTSINSCSTDYWSHNLSASQLLVSTDQPENHLIITVMSHVQDDCLRATTTKLQVIISMFNEDNTFNRYCCNLVWSYFTYWHFALSV